MRQPATMKDLAPAEQIQMQWGMLGLWTIDEAALIMGGIDPDDCDAEDGRSFKSAERFAHWEAYKYARFARRAIVTAIAIGELSPFELWVYEPLNINYYESKAVGGYVPNCDEVLTDKTRLIPKTLGVWLKSKGIKTFRQIVESRQTICAMSASMRQEAITTAPPAVAYIEYKPKHDTPALEVANEISREIWDRQRAGDRPPKALVTKDIIAQKYFEKTGVKPQAAEIQRIDRIARPIIYKNQHGELNG